MRKILAGLALIGVSAGYAQACNTVVFDYESFSRPPMKIDLDRYLAGNEETDYLSVGLNGITLQISPANWEIATGFRAIWEAWAARGETHAMAAQFQTYFDRPLRVDTPFATLSGASLTGYLSPIMDAYRPKDDPTQRNTILFAFVEDENGSGAASLYLNDPTGEGDMEAVMDEYAKLTTIDASCISDTGAYEGRYLPDQAQYVVFPVEAFSDND
ncbi:hypothetical protein [uncultured Sulfitobacter sp.]|uniref:hypothetical protein n=1 Tax=uncultured Sulfitobacter sp. TaxID=191468 RepID=UPI002629FFC3|nr:hypothetical protein [uncultured Sulfitobacter sp.]